MGDEWPWLPTRLRSEGLCLSVVNKVWTYITYGALLEGEPVGQGSEVPSSFEHHTMRLSFWMNHERSHSGDGGVPSPTMGGGRVSALKGAVPLALGLHSTSELLASFSSRWQRA